MNWIAADILRIEDGLLVEHWDVIAKGRPLRARAQRRFASAFGDNGAADLRTVLKKVATADFGDSASPDNGAAARKEHRKA